MFDKAEEFQITDKGIEVIVDLKRMGFMFKLEMAWAIFWLNLTCRLWELRGLKICKRHGFHAQSWIDGRCRKCEGVERDGE
jgi:hypothetical protein